MRHKVTINVADRSGNRQQVLESRKITLPMRLLRLIFGDFTQVLVLTPSSTVEGIEIRELKGGTAHEAL